MPTDRIPVAAVTAEELLLRDALGDAPFELISREPLGAGSVAGFHAVGSNPQQTYFVDTSRLAVAAETGWALGADPAHPEARIWVHPADPHLPALAPTAFEQAADMLLQRLGIRGTGPGTMVAYRPGRRAVLRMPTGDGAVWVKVVRPSRIRRIVDAHAACAAAGLPVPAVLGWSPGGLLVLEEAPGAPAMSWPGNPHDLLDEVDRLRGRIAAVGTSSAVSPITTRLAWYAEHAGPSERVAVLATRIGGSLDGTDAAPARTVHGDLHLGQLFLRDGKISALIDVDTLGAGTAAEDTAAFVSHLVASSVMSPPSARPALDALTEAALARWDPDPAMRPYASIHLLGHAVAARDAGHGVREAALLSAAEGILSGSSLRTADLRTLS